MTRKPIQRKIPSQLFVYLFFDEIAIWNRFCNMAVCKAGPPTHTCIESRFWVLKKWSPLEQQYYRGGSHNLCSDYSCPLFLIKYRRNSSVKKPGEIESFEVPIHHLRLLLLLQIMRPLFDRCNEQVPQCILIYFLAGLAWSCAFLTFCNIITR